jgi:hypothetical protein
LRRSIDLAEEVTLQSNLNQIQMVIGMYKQDNEGKVPATYDELKKYAKLPGEMWTNPVDKKPLDYDPSTGQMIVTPYEGESPAIARMTANPMHGADQPVAPAAPAAPGQDTAAAPAPPASGPAGPGGIKMPVIPNSSSDPSAGAGTE